MQKYDRRQQHDPSAPHKNGVPKRKPGLIHAETFLRELETGFVFMRKGLTSITAYFDIVSFGPEILPLLAKHLQMRHPNTKTASLNPAGVDWNMLRIWVTIIRDIQRQYSLPMCPYHYKVDVRVMDVSEWCNHCYLIEYYLED